MIKTIDLNRDLAGLVKLEGRGAHTTEDEAQASAPRTLPCSLVFSPPTGRFTGTRVPPHDSNS